jgi:hypothetical protein
MTQGRNDGVLKKRYGFSAMQKKKKNYVKNTA